MKYLLSSVLLVAAVVFLGSGMLKDGSSSEKEKELYTKLVENNDFLRRQNYINEKELKELLIKSSVVESKVTYDKIKKELAVLEEAFANDKTVLIKDYNEMVDNVLLLLQNYLKEYEQRNFDINYMQEEYLVAEDKYDYSLEELENDYLLFKNHAFEIFQYSGMAYGCKFIEFPKPLNIYKAKNDSTNKVNLTFNFYETFSSDYYKNWDIEITNSSIPLEKLTNNIFEIPKDITEPIIIEGKVILDDDFDGKIVRTFKKYLHPNEVEASIN